MTEKYLQIDSISQAKVLRAAAAASGRSPSVLEKDVWLCWGLGALFEMPSHHPMAFKGGTSLSKVYQVIARFSEDIDITIDYHALDPSADPLDQKLSRSQFKALSQSLRDRAISYVNEQIIPYLRTKVADDLPKGVAKILPQDDGESVRIEYASAVDSAEARGYIANSVLLEFGGRNKVVPAQLHTIAPYAASYTADLSFPTAKVTVLAAERTFWEKVTLIHAACQREEFPAGAGRQSRHWYDLAKLADHDIGKRASSDFDLMRDVVALKKAFFYAANYNYDACLASKIRLVPSENALHQLTEDFEAMVGAGMFEGTPPKIGDVMNRLKELQDTLNSAIKPM